MRITLISKPSSALVGLPVPMTTNPLAVDPPEFYAGNAVAMEQTVLETLVAANVTAGRDK